MRNIRSLFDKTSDSQSDHEEKGDTESFAGGHKSGLAVQYPGNTEKKALSIKSYSNGFIVDDGPFRPFSDPNNTRFMSDLRSGTVPDELRHLAMNPEAGIQVSLSEIDAQFTESESRSTDQRVGGTAEKAQPFAGQGRTLNQESPNKPDMRAFSVDNFPNPPVGSDSAAVIQIRLPGGQRISRTFASSTTGEQFRQYIATGLGMNEASILILSGFPPKPLEGDQLGVRTVEELGLSGSSVQVTIK